MKKNTLKSGALVALAAGVALVPNYAHAAAGKLDYAKKLSADSEIRKVIATEDGGYVTAGTYTGVSGCYYKIGDEKTHIQDPENDNDPTPSCGFVSKYTAAGAEVWKADLAIDKYGSFWKEYETTNQTTGETTTATPGYAYLVKPLEMAETENGIAMITEGADVFLLDGASGEIKKNYGLSTIQSEDSFTLPYRMFINHDGSVSYGDFHKNSVNNLTNDGGSGSGLTELTITPQSIAKQKNNYIIAADEGTYKCSESLECTEMSEFKNYTGDVMFENGQHDVLSVITGRDIDSKTGEIANFLLIDGEVVDSMIEKYTKTSGGTSTPVTSDDDWTFDDGDAITKTSAGHATAQSYTVTNKKTGDKKKVVGVASYGKKFKYFGEVEVAANASTNYIDMAFLKDNSLIAVGTNGQNGEYDHYTNMVLLSTPKTTTKASNVKNPKTADNTPVFVASLVAALGAGFVFIKRLMRR